VHVILTSSDGALRFKLLLWLAKILEQDSDVGRLTLEPLSGPGAAFKFASFDVDKGAGPSVNVRVCFGAPCFEVWKMG